jgi:hypothetical protein
MNTFEAEGLAIIQLKLLVYETNLRKVSSSM